MHPRVTLFLFAYNHERFVADACRAAFAQTYSPLEIVLSDDCSSDATFQRLSEAASSYTGPHKVLLNKNPRNLGLIGHVNRCFELSSGDLIVFAAGDDISHPERVERLVEAYQRLDSSDCLLHSSATMISTSGVRQGVLVPPLAQRELPINLIAECFALYIGATGAISRSLMDRFGDIAFPEAYEDLVFAFRAALIGKIHYVDEELVDYRIGAGITSQHINSKKPVSRQDRLQRTEMRIAVLRQRLRDLQCIGGDADYSDIAVRITSRMDELLDRKAFLDGPRALFGRLSRLNFARMMRAAVSEAQALAKGK